MGTVEGRSDGGQFASLLECQCAIQANAVTYTHTTAAQDTEVIIPIVKWIIFLHGKTTVVNRVGALSKTYLIDNFLELATGIIGTVSATRGYTDLAYRPHIFLALVVLIAEETACRMFAQKQFKDFLP
jgi:hypothetical protein